MLKIRMLCTKVFWLLLTIFLSSCSTSHPHPQAGVHARAIRILCVGDSITVGYTDNPDWRVPFEFGYRAPLFGIFRSNHIAMQFVGGSKEPWDGLWKLPTNQPVLDLRLLDADHHDGYGGKGSGFVAEHIEGWIRDSQPDFVLLMIGINDIAPGSMEAPEGTRSNLRAILQTATTARPETHVIVAQITPYTRPTPAILDLNKFIRESLVPEFSARGAKVSTVDQCANLVNPGETTGNPSMYSNGINHPNSEGYQRMAQTWFAEIKRLLPK